MTFKSRSRQPSTYAKQNVRDTFDAAKLQDICVRQDFTNYAKRFDLAPAKDGHERFYYYQDNGSDILAVADLDSVQENGTCTISDTAAGLLACSGTLDDRLGAYVILEMLPQLGINCDWLLSTDEEICRSTAEYFTTEKQYNWIIQFDRGGTDVVMYEYETPELVDLVKKCGAPVGLGSFSDICVLTHLGCAGFNWGVGYRDYHGPRSHAWLEDTFRMVARFVKFHRANADKFFRHIDNWQVISNDVYCADCGHEIDLNDETTYDIEDNFFVCVQCGPNNAWGTIPAEDEGNDDEVLT